VVQIALLEVTATPGRARRLQDGTIIGRSKRCDIRLDDAFVSRRHARVISSEVGIAIEDLGSANGVYVNGRRSEGVTVLHPGDLVQMGGTLWLVRER
jgi:pSer/pThr/pTyr-binding forkhead associated (FHA) protein